MDDAIVVVEAAASIEHGLSPREATIQAMDEVAGPDHRDWFGAVGGVRACVFITGIVGEFYRQFAVTIVVSTLISAFNSLTLSPALCALLLVPPNPNARSWNLEPVLRVAITLAGVAGGAAVGCLFVPELLLSRVSTSKVWKPVGGHYVAAGATGVVVGAVTAVLYYFIRRAGDLTSLYCRVDIVTTSPVVAGAVHLRRVTLPHLRHAEQSARLVSFRSKIKATCTGECGAAGRRLVEGTEGETRKTEAIALKTPGVKHTVSVSGQSVMIGTNASNFATLYVMLDDFPNASRPELSADAIAAETSARAFRRSAGVEDYRVRRAGGGRPAAPPAASS